MSVLGMESEMKFANRNSQLKDFQTSHEILEEPPLLEELGIDMRNVVKKLKTTTLLQKPLEDFMEESDMTGPILLMTCLGMLLLLKRKISFGFIYGYGFFGSLIIYFLLNMLLDNYIQLYDVISLIGYNIAPILFVSVLNLFVNLRNPLGILLSVFFSILSTFQVVRILGTKFKLEKTKSLISYPLFLLYQTFIILIIS